MQEPPVPFDKNFFKKSEFHRCGQAKAGHKGDANPEEVGAVMEVEATFEEKIADLEGVIKGLKVVKDSPTGKAQLELWETQLKQL